MKLLFLLILLISCQNKDDRSKSLNLHLESNISGLDPAFCFDVICNEVIGQVYEPLFEYEYFVRPYKLKPLLAKEMPHISNDGLTYTIKLKKNILYHPQEFLKSNRSVIAQDFINQIKRIAFLPTNSRGWWLFKNKIQGLDEWRKKVGSDLEQFFKQDVIGLQAPNEHTLIIKLTKPFPQLIYALAMNFSVPIPAEAIKTLNNELSLKTIGTGPYTIEFYNPNQKVIFKKFPHYNSSTYPQKADEYSLSKNHLKDAQKKLPFIDKITVEIIKEEQTAWLNFLSKRIDVIKLLKDNYQVALTPELELKKEYQDKNIEMQNAQTMIYYWLSFNMKDPLVGKNLNLRKAIAHAIDMKKYLRLFTYNVASQANSIFPPGIYGHNQEAELPYRYDLKKAKHFLAKAGHPNGQGLPTIRYDVRGDSGYYRQMAEFIQKELSVIGIKLEIMLNPFPQFLEKSRKGKLQFWQGGWVLDYPDAENVVQLLTKASFPPGPNTSFYENSQVENLVSKLKKLPNGPQKVELMSKINTIVNQELPWIMQYYRRNIVLFHSGVKNYRYSDLIYNQYKYLRLE